MATFADAQQVYDMIGAFLAQIMADDGLGPKFTAANTTFQIHCTNPECGMVVDCTNAPPTVTYGRVMDDAEITLRMVSDDGQGMWLDDLNVALPPAKGKVRVTGPASKITKLMPAMRPAVSRYKEFLTTGHNGLGC